MKRRVFAVCLCVLFLLTALTSFAVIVEAADHDCTGEDCPICAEVALCTQLLRRLPLILLVFACASRLFYAVRKTTRRVYLPAFCTPVTRFDVLNS
ncbi:MAG: hypothetical protein IJS44_00835 [Clostridia bacterium]|nr:hypothetical protein [Clostridia bacterium]